MIRRLGWQAFVRLRALGPYLEELSRFQTLSGSDARRELASRLIRQVRYFAQRDDAFPEWRDVARIRDPDEFWQIWPTLPCVTKADLQTRFRPEEIQARESLTGVVSATGGSTGEPTPYLHDPPMLRCATARRYFTRRQLGWQPGMPTIGVWGSERDIGRQHSVRNRISGWLRNDWLIAGYQLDQGTVERFLAELARHRRVAMFGFTSMLEFLARSILEQNATLPGQVVAAWNGGEMLYPGQSELFLQAFGVPLQNLYGGRELGPMAYQPAGSDGLYVLRPAIYVEVVDERNRPVSPGETGRLLCTSTVCRGTPFLRYDIGDVASFNPGDMDESGVRRIGTLQGRTAGLLTLATGRTINCIFWNHLFKDIPEVRQFQVVLRGDRELRLRLQGSGWSTQREQNVRGLLKNLLGELPIGVDWVSSIPTTSQGKRVQVVREP